MKPYTFTSHSRKRCWERSIYHDLVLDFLKRFNYTKGKIILLIMPEIAKKFGKAQNRCLKIILSGKRILTVYWENLNEFYKTNKSKNFKIIM